VNGEPARTRSTDRGACAALDLGTNTFLITVGRIGAGGALEVLEDACRTPRLGAGLASTGRLSSEAIDRGLAVLAEFAQRLQRLDVRGDRVRAVGTAALRRAANAAEFVAAAHARSGLEIEIIAEQEEARLGFAAVRAESASDDLVIIDVGGGSTEVVSNRGRARRSMPLGAVVLTERGQGHLDGAVWTDSAWSQLLRAVDAGCAVLPERFAEARDSSAPEVVVLGGTAANLACLAHGLARFDVAAAEGRWVGAEQAAAWAERLRRLEPRRRLEFPVEPERASILPAGLACLAGALARGGAADFRATGRGLRYGVLRELLATPSGGLG
jgi:exopolyphosphatase/guanosine-5'-triphosphate,3'-diphosphate pyrophosphatase